MVTHRSVHPRLVASLLTAALLLAACGSDTPGASDAASTSAPDEELVDASSGSSSTAPPSEPTTTPEPSTTTSPTTPTTATTEPAQECVQVPLDATSSAEPGPPPDDVVVLLDRNGLQLCLGPALVDSTVVESADVSISQSGDWTVLPVFTVDGIEQFNAAAASCSTTGPDVEVCPSSRLAIVDGYTVVSSPTIHAANFERDQIIISGNFTELEARELAATLAAEGIVLRPVLADLGPPTSPGE